MSKIGLIVEGGGMKCAYSAGILDAFIDENITFDYAIGVSADLLMWHPSWQDSVDVIFVIIQTGSKIRDISE